VQDHATDAPKLPAIYHRHHRSGMVIPLQVGREAVPPKNVTATTLRQPLCATALLNKRLQLTLWSSC
jgi:hypothetical protein